VRTSQQVKGKHSRVVGQREHFLVRPEGLFDFSVAHDIQDTTGFSLVTPNNGWEEPSPEETSTGCGDVEFPTPQK